MKKIKCYYENNDAASRGVIESRGDDLYWILAQYNSAESVIYVLVTDRK
jgi:hypothetical protein